MLDFSEAQQRLASAGKAPGRMETIPLARALGRVLAQDVMATLSLPAADNSAMDGYAVRHAEACDGQPLPVQQRCYAGQAPEPLQPGHCIRLFTGSLVPVGADTVVMQEDADEVDGVLRVRACPAVGTHIRRQGEDVRAGALLLPAGTRLQAGHIGLLASQGLGEVAAYPVLRVGILTSGDELAQPGQAVTSAQVYDSNGPMLAALVQGLGAQVSRHVHAPDNLPSLQQAFEQLLADSDLVLTVGGVSVGEKDLVKPALEAVGGTLDLWKVKMRPGKPVALAHAAGKPVVCLPGNPVSAFAVFTLLVTPLLRALQGRRADDLLPVVPYGAMAVGRTEPESREDFLRVQVVPHADGLPRLTPYPQQGSNILSAVPWAHALARIPAGQRIQAGDAVQYYPLDAWLR